ncbi:urease accessory protein UreD [Puniceibacterium sediminis]|uniref:Urease accessory protein UreD n=1 Tax=Puniceibacterium sediminis TaxID=1608407 RepID=A0A238WZP9_9RHOB|nr:urease accessory protein UreD [Puniceibacterium sediminis]SNR52046.1 urease accessory protein [Puniceibacterium sediminis]
MTKAPAPAAQRARGRTHLAARCRSDQTVIADLHQSGASRLLFPRPSGAALPAVWLNTSGGVTGGDQFSAHFEAAAGAHLSLTSQAAERVYRALPGDPGRVETTLTIASGARIDWLPQETILFDCSALDRTLNIDMAGDSTLLAVETLIFGRAAMGETVRELSLRDRIALRIDGHLAFADRLRLDGDADATLARRFVAAGCGAVSSVIFASPGAGRHLDTLRALLPDGAGVSALTDDLLFLRITAPDGFDMRRSLIPILRHLSGGDLPRPWML